MISTNSPDIFILNEPIFDVHGPHIGYVIIKNDPALTPEQNAAIPERVNTAVDLQATEAQRTEAREWLRSHGVVVQKGGTPAGWVETEAGWERK